MIKISLQDAIKRMERLVVDEVKDGFIVGLGSGSTVARFIETLASRIKECGLKVRFVPSSLQIQLVADKFGLSLEDPGKVSGLDLTVDSADQVDEGLNLIKGGGGALLREKVLISASKKTIILIDEKKYSKKLNRAVPIEVLPFARSFVFEQLKAMNGKPQLRVNEKGYPILTENSNLIFDTEFGEIEDPSSLERKVKEIPGIIEVGIFTKNIHRVVMAKEDGSVAVLSSRL
ncbi:MAG: ribose 5-phosphate isomerase A [Nitrososphaerota archaeon]